MPKPQASVAKVELVEDCTGRSTLTEGYLRLYRWTLRNTYADGTVSPPYGCDVIDRAGLDAVGVVLYAINAAERKVNVLLRETLRPGLMLRAKRELPLPELRELPVTWEIVAGVIEPGERGLSAINQRAAAEVREEAGFDVYGPAVVDLGAGILPTPGPFPEKIYLKAVEVDPADQGAPTGDGSPMEQGAALRWFDLGTAIQMCVNGQIEDAKTEIALRRLAQRLGYLADVDIWTDQIGRAK